MKTAYLNVPEGYTATMTNQYGHHVHYTPEADGNGMFYAMAYGPRAKKNHDWHFRFRSMDSLRSYALAYFDKVMQAEDAKQQRRKERKAKQNSLKASDHWSVGDVVKYSWGYDQTNVDWFQVVEVKAKSVVIRPIAGKMAERGMMCGFTQPDRYKFTGAPELKVLTATGGIRFSFGYGSKWDGKAAYCSWYA